MPVNVPIYQPRLPIKPMGGVFQPRGGTPYKPNIGAELAGGLPALLAALLQGRQLKEQRERGEQTQDLRDALLQAQTQLTQSKAEIGPRAGKRVIRGKKNWWIVDPYTGEQKDTGIPIADVSLFGGLGLEDISGAGIVTPPGKPPAPGKPQAPKPGPETSYFDRIKQQLQKLRPRIAIKPPSPKDKDKITPDWWNATEAKAYTKLSTALPKMPAELIKAINKAMNKGMKFTEIIKFDEVREYIE